MARLRRSRALDVPQTIPEPAPTPDAALNPEPRGEFSTGGMAQTTGRYLVVYKDEVLGSPNEVLQSLNRVCGVRDVSSAADYEHSAIDPDDAGEAEALYFPALGIAVVTADNDRLQSMLSASASADSNIQAIEPEYIYQALSEPSPLEYLRGYRDAVNHLYDQLSGKLIDEGIEATAAFRDSAQFTWGLEATGASVSRFSGQGIKVAILDTGLDLLHADFLGRRVVSQSFIPGQSVQDAQGHGTHCTGTACGPQRPSTGVRRYGCAYGAEIHIGKVLSNSGSSVGSSVLNGMNWAVTNRCQVISMSLGGPIDQISQAFELAGRRAMQAGSLMIAAAGNESRRSAGVIRPVGQPANSTSIMSVAAVDSQLRVADFSNRSSSSTGNAGKIDIAAPGVGVFSSIPGGRHAAFNGTSMATPHVAGIAALWAQASGRTGMSLWTTLIQNARRIAGDVRDFGSGLVQAP